MNDRMNETLNSIPGVRPIECPRCGLHIIKKDAGILERDLECVSTLKAGMITNCTGEAYIPKRGDVINIEAEVGGVDTNGFYVTIYGVDERVVLKHEHFLHLHAPKVAFVHRSQPRRVTMTEFREQFGEDAVLKGE